jgi:hypothetical protein
MNINFEINEEALWGVPESVVSVIPPKATVEIVLSAKEPAAGYLSFEVRGFPVEEARLLRRGINTTSDAYHAVLEYERARALALNPAGIADPAAQAFAEATSAGETQEIRRKAILRYMDAARLVCFLGVQGYAEGTLLHKGVDVPYSVEEREVFGKPRSGLARKPLALLEVSTLTIGLAQQILRVSAQQPALTKEQQWGKPAPSAPEKAKAATPTLEAPVETQEASHVAPGSLLPSDSGSTLS